MWKKPKFCFQINNNLSLVQRPVLHTENTISTVKRGGGSIMWCGCLVRLESKYREVQDENTPQSDSGFLISMNCKP